SASALKVTTSILSFGNPARVSATKSPTAAYSEIGSFLSTCAIASSPYDCDHPHLPISFCVTVGADKMQRDVWFIAHHPTVVRNRRDVEKVAGRLFDPPPVTHRGDRAA